MKLPYSNKSESINQSIPDEEDRGETAVFAG